MMSGAVRMFLLVAAMALTAAGCATARPATEATALNTAPAGPEGDYRLQRGDIVDVKLFYAPELNETNLTIRPDGKVSLQLIGEVPVAGLTTEEMTTTLRQRYTGILKDPEIAVIVRKFTGLKAYVAGEVNKPGLIAYDGPITVLQALIQAEWLKGTAEPTSVVILRDTGNGTPSVHFVDVRKLVDEPAAAREMVLRPYDIVYVPKSKIASVQAFIDNYIDKIALTPISRLAGFSFAYQLNAIRVPLTATESGR
jgi:protein involved in polysaccharide export with SLBB domain